MNDLTKYNQYREQHRDRLAQLIRDARQQDGTGVPIYYLGGYCDNSRCDVREVRVRVKDFTAASSLKEFRCPFCRGLLLFTTETLTPAREYGDAR